MMWDSLISLAAGFIDQIPALIETFNWFAIVAGS